MIKAIVFDYDGTLSNGELFDYEALKDFFRPYYPEMSEMDFEVLLQNLNKSSIFNSGPQNFRYRCHQYLDKYHITDEMISKLEDYWENEAFKFAKLRDHAMDVVLELKKNYKIGILTNGGSLRQHKKIELSGLQDVIDGLSISDEVGARKPDIRMYQDICDKLDVKFDECIFVGDSFSGDIYGAYKCGMIPVWITVDPDIPGGLDILRIYHLEDILDVVKEIDKE